MESKIRGCVAHGGLVIAVAPPSLKRITEIGGLVKLTATVALSLACVGASAQMSTSFSTTATFPNRTATNVSLPKFDADAIGLALDQDIQLTSVTLSLTGGVSGTLSAQNNGSVTGRVYRLQINVIDFYAVSTNIGGGLDIGATNSASFLSRDVANPDIILPPGISTSFQGVAASSGSYSNGYPAVISEAVRSAFTGSDAIHFELYALAVADASFDSGLGADMPEATAIMLATITYTWEVIPEPGALIPIAAAGLGMVWLGRRRSRRAPR